MKADFTAQAAKQNRPNQTQIVATLGPATNTYETIRKLWEEGADTFRLNFSHGSHEDHGKLIDTIRQVEKDVGRPIGILADMQGPKLRIGAFKDDMKVPLTPGKRIRFDLDPALGDETRVCFPHPDVLSALEVGARFLMDEGYVGMKIVEKGDGYVIAENVFGKQLSGKKGVNVPDLSRRVGTLTPKDMSDMEFALSKGVDWIAQSFVQSADDVKEAKRFIKGRAKLIAKLEKPDALVNLKEIVAAADAIMVARGDLAVETPQEEVPAAQYAMITEAIAQNKPVIVATHMFESMINNPRPTRAEISDVALAVRQGASAVMLSGETTIGKYPVEAVAIMDQTVQHAETNDLYSRKTLKSAVAPALSPRPSLQETPATISSLKVKFG